MHRRPDTRFRLELGDQISTLLTKVGIFPDLMRDIREYPILLDIWRDMPHDLMPLMRHIVGAFRVLAARRAPDE